MGDQDTGAVGPGGTHKAREDVVPVVRALGLLGKISREQMKSQPVGKVPLRVRRARKPNGMWA